MATPTPDKTLDVLFPLPATTGSHLSPAPRPGISSAAAKKLAELLKDNHDRHHIFFNNKGFHNHATHHLYAIYTLGATPEVLQAAYETHKEYQRPAFDAPGEITEKNWKDHLGDENYYRSYVAFYADSILKHGIDMTLEGLVFENLANWDVALKDDTKQPQMVNRLFSGVLHPLIHAGHACEFGAPGMLAEGLAMASVTHKTDFDAIITKDLFISSNTSTSALSRLTAALSLSSPTASAKKGVDSFSIVSRMLNDPELAPGSACSIPTSSSSDDDEATFPLQEVLDKKGELIRKYAGLWTVNTEDKEEVKEKVEELSWLVTVLYGVSGLEKGKEFKADFFMMHLVTSSLFLSSYIVHLTPPSQSILLRTYLASILAVWVSRGRPEISISSFYSRTSPSVVPPGPKPTPSKDALTPDALFPNTWLPLLQSTILHPNEHLPKAERALAHYASLYGTAEKGKWNYTELADADMLDGTLFARVAGLTMGRLGWLREGDERGEWDFSGFWQ